MKKIIYLVLLFSYCLQAVACRDLEKILAIDDIPQKVNFYYAHPQSNSIEMIELNFWNNKNCLVDSLGFYHSIAQQGIPIHFQQVFSILPNGIFKIAKEELSFLGFSKIRAISLKFMNTSGHMAKFLDGCQISGNSQECCLPIHCHPSEENCDFDIELPMQKFIF
jgi:hypothetical protein